MASVRSAAKSVSSAICQPGGSPKSRLKLLAICRKKLSSDAQAVELPGQGDQNGLAPRLVKAALLELIGQFGSAGGTGSGVGHTQ